MSCPSGSYTVDIVGSIANHAFYNCDSLTSVIIGDSVTSIGYEAFAACLTLTSITVSSGNTHFNSVDGVLFSFNGDILIQVPGGLVGSYSIQDSVTSIGSYAFYGCGSLSSVTIPDSVTTIGTGSFGSRSWNSKLTLIDVSSGNTHFKSIDGVLFSFNGSDLIQFPGGLGGSYSAPDSVTSISDKAFQYCQKLSSVTLPDSVISIGSYAFQYCTSLISVIIGASL